MRWAGYGFVSAFRSLHAPPSPLQPLQPMARGSDVRANAIQSGMPSVENNIMPLLQPDSFERWDLEEPRHSCPNVLYALTPCGLRTPYVESFSSYVTRLAEAHVVTVWRLIRHVFPQSLNRIPRCETRYAYPANGLGKTSHIFLESFQAATGRNDLRLLTLSVLQGAVSQPNIFRTTEAWCPGCLEHWRTIDAPVYSPLLWTIRAVTVCPVHASPLLERCPHCDSRFASLRVKARPGYCAICSEWLGSFDLPLSQHSVDEQQYNLWASTSIAQVVTAMPELEPSELHVRLIANLECCLRQSDGATKWGLSTLAGAGPCAFRSWISARVKPTLHHLCRLSYELQIPLVMLFKGVPDEWRGPEYLAQRIAPRSDKRRAQPAAGEPQLPDILAICLTQDPPPSVAEVARRLNFRRAQTLWAREPQLCRQIAARHRDSRTIGHAAKHVYKRSERRRLESVLRRHLASKNPLSLNEIASVLGYKGASSIRSRFPEICRAIMAKRNQQSIHRKQDMRRALENARTENPPPSLMQIARRFGFTSENMLTATFPVICASHKQWRQNWLEQQRTKLRLSIREWIAAQPAATVAAVSLHFGVSKAYLQLYFPEENAELVRRSAERERIAREHRDAVLRKEIFEIVRKLREQDIYPSLQRVKSALTPGLPRSWLLLRPIIDEAKSQFGAAIRPRNELGQFV